MPGSAGTSVLTTAEVVDHVRRTPRGVVSTVDAARGPEAALVDFAVTDEGELVFDSREDARKVANLVADPRVALVVGCGDVSLQVEGLAEVAAGRAREVYGRVYEARFPGSRALVAGFAVVVVRPRWARLYDATTNPPRVVEGDLAPLEAPRSRVDRTVSRPRA